MVGGSIVGGPGKGIRTSGPVCTELRPTCVATLSDNASAVAFT
jgi:hypothetical protein